jgi:hypothetical protein
MIDDDLMREIMEKQAQDMEMRCKFDRFIMVLFAFGLGVAVTGFALYYFN